MIGWRGVRQGDQHDAPGRRDVAAGALSRGFGHNADAMRKGLLIPVVLAGLLVVGAGVIDLYAKTPVHTPVYVA